MILFKKRTILVFIFGLVSSISFALDVDTATTTNNQEIKKGWTVGGVPALAFDSDLGFRYGLVANIYNYGNGSSYPEYKHSVYLEWSRTTKGSGTNDLVYDSKYLIPHVRLSAVLCYNTEQTLDFYGINGYNAYYSHDIELQKNAEYSRMFYRMDRKILNIKTDFSGAISDTKLLWYGGFAYYGVHADTVDINKLNEGKSESERLPYIGGGLYQKFADWGLIPLGQIHGGNVNMLRMGVMFDNRDTETSPDRGIFSDAQLIVAPSLIGNKSPYSRVALTYRQYLPIVSHRLNLSYRLSYQAKLSGNTPFYMLPLVMNMAPAFDRDGLGGAKTLRGILRNRIVGEDFAFANIEIRYKVFQKVLFKQNFSGTMAPFFDMGMVTRNYNFGTVSNPQAQAWLDKGKPEGLHNSYGLGLYGALNENFVIAVNYGRAISKADGIQGLYINIGYIF